MINSEHTTLKYVLATTAKQTGILGSRWEEKSNGATYFHLN